MKDRSSTSVKANVKVTAIHAMTAEEERRFTAAIDALLAQWAQRLVSREVRGENHVRQNED